MRAKFLRHLILLLLVGISGIPASLGAIGRINIDYARESRLLSFDLISLIKVDPNPASREVDNYLLLWQGKSSPFGEDFIIRVGNPNYNQDSPASIIYSSPDLGRTFDQDPIKLEIHSAGLYRDSRTGDPALMLGCLRNDSAFAVKVVPGTDTYQSIFLTAGKDLTGNNKWDAGIPVLMCADYDYDGTEEVFMQVYPARDLYPRTLFCLDPDKGCIEWSLPVSGAISRNSIYSCKDSLNPSIIFTTYNVKNKASDKNFSDLFCQVAIVDSRGKILFNRIVSEEHGGVQINPSEVDSIFYISHSLPFIAPSDSSHLPQTIYQLSRLSRSGKVLLSVEITERPESMWLDEYRAGVPHLYTISPTGRVRIFDPRLNLWAESNKTNLRMFMGFISIPENENAALVIKTGTGTVIYSHNFRKLAELDYPTSGYIPMEPDEQGEYHGILFFAGNSLCLTRIEKKQMEDYSKILFWDYQKYIILALLVLLIALLITHILRMRTIRLLKISRRNLDQLFKSNPEAAVYTDTMGLIVDINPRFQNLFGFSKDEACGKSIFDLLVPEYQVEETAAKYRNIDSPLTYEAVRKRKDGMLMHVHVSGAEVRAEKTLLGYVILYEDITEIRKAREDLKENAARYRTLFEESPILLAEEDYSEVMPYVRGLIGSGASDLKKYFLGNPELLTRCESMIKLVNVNKTALRTYKAESVDELKNHFKSTPSEDSREALAGTLAAFVEGRNHSEHEIATNTVTGEKLHIYIKVSVAPGYEESFSKVYISILDITERKLAEDDLRHSEEKYRLLVQNVGAAISLFDARGNILYVNDNVAGLFGENREALIGRTMWDIFPRNTADRQIGVIKDIIATGKELSTESQVPIDGNLRWFSTRLQPYRDKNGIIVAALVIAYDITDRIRAEERVRSSEGRLRAIINSIDDLIFVIDRKGYFTYFEQAGRNSRLYQNPQDFIGRHVGEVLPPEVSYDFLRDFEKISISGESTQLDYALTIGGEQHWYSARLSPLLNADGTFEGVTAVAREITPQVRANLELKNERDFTRSILETANSLIICLDNRANIKIFNDECEKVTGYKREEVIGKNWPAVFLPGEYRHDGLVEFAAWVRNNPRDKYEGPIITKSGEVRTILWSNSAIIDPATGEVTAIAIGQDITLRRMVEEAHRKSENRLKAQFKNFPIPSYTWKKENDDFILIDFNDAALQITDGKIREMRGIRIRELYRERPGYIEDVQNCYKNRTNVLREADYQYITTGQKKHLIINYVFVPPDQVMIFTQDITDLKRAKIEKLRQARDIAGGFAHEIRNSLFPAKAALTLLSRSSNAFDHTKGDAEKYVGITGQAIEKAIDITNQITQYTRMESEYFPEKVVLHEVIAKVLKANLLDLEEAGIRITCSGAEDIIVYSNNKQLYQVLNNLLINSIDALTKTPNPVIFLTWKQLDSGVHLNFADNGEGIPSTNVERIFDAFYSTKPDNGTGIGLAMAKKIIEMYDGSISVESIPDKGTTFKLKMKRA